MKRTTLLLLFCLVQGWTSSEAQVATGGTFVLEKSVTAAGGNTSSGGISAISGTAGQAVSGPPSSGGAFGLSSGFWTPDPLVPTSAAAIVSGRVLSSTGRPINRALVSLTAMDGSQQTSITNSFGYFKFPAVKVGSSYLVEATHRRFEFVPQVISITADISGLEIVASP